MTLPSVPAEVQELEALHAAATGPYRAGVLFGLLQLARRRPDVMADALAEARSFEELLKPDAAPPRHWSFGRRGEARRAL